MIINLPHIHIKAIRNFPIGTKFISHFGATDIVTEDIYKIDIINNNTSDPDVYAKTKSGWRLIYNGSTWAQILKD